MLQVSSLHYSDCVIKREHEKCMERMAEDDPENDLEFSRFCICVYVPECLCACVYVYLFGVFTVCLGFSSCGFL